jgi:hypothetical protein
MFMGSMKTGRHSAQESCDVFLYPGKRRDPVSEGPPLDSASADLTFVVQRYSSRADVLNFEEQAQRRFNALFNPL